MYVIAGLGNPGKKYEHTRHNMGFLVLDALASRLGVRVSKIKHKALIGEGNIAGEKVLLVKPQTYMNLSGESLREVMSYYKVPIENLIVIYDDLDLEVGTLRIRKKGSAGSHNGMKSVIYQLQDDSFPRVRVGIGDDNGVDRKDYVTGNVSKEDAEVLAKTIETAADAVTSMVADGVDIAMNKYNTKKKKEEKIEEPKEEEEVKEA